MQRIVLQVLALLLLAASGTVAAHECARHAVYGDIAARYRALGGETGPLGCPLSDEADARDGGRFNQFEHGQISWSPREGGHMTVAAWQQGDSVMLEWGPTREYDKFLVRHAYEGGEAQQVDWDGGTTGRFQFNVDRPGRYTIVVEGCDEGGFLASSDCGGWSVPVDVQVREPQGVAGGVHVLFDTVGQDRHVFDRAGFLSDALNRGWAMAREPLCREIVRRAGVADAAGPGYTLRDIDCDLGTHGVLFLEDASGTSGAIDLVFQVPHNRLTATTTQPTLAGSWADPRFTLSYEVMLHARLDPLAMKLLGAEYRVINPGRPWPENVPARLLVPIDGILKEGVLRSARAAVQASGRLDVSALNAQLADAADPLARYRGDKVSWRIAGGDLAITFRDPILDAKVVRRRLQIPATAKATRFRPIGH